jgi:phage N-6-adenine-methyltransferase
MSLVGFKASNHPQQADKRGARPDVDDRAITPEDFAPLHERFRFTIDAAASESNARLPRFWTVDDDALEQSWRGERVWCNPPYSDIETWVRKAWQEHHAGCTLIVMLLPANRTEQGWWQRRVEMPRRRCELDVEFLSGRMRFIRPNAVIGPKGDRPPFGCCLVIWERSNGC